MTEYKIYSNLPTAPPQENYHWDIIQSKRRGLLKLEEKYKKKYKKYAKILDRLLWLNASSSGITLASGVSSVATMSTFIGLPVSIPLAAVSLTGASISGVATVLIKKYQKKLPKVAKLIDIVTPALAEFEKSVSRALKDHRIDEQEFSMLQALHLKVLDKLSSLDRKMEAENRTQLQKSLLEKISDLEKKVGGA